MFTFIHLTSDNKLQNYQEKGDRQTNEWMDKQMDGRTNRGTKKKTDKLSDIVTTWATHRS